MFEEISFRIYLDFGFAELAVFVEVKAYYFFFLVFVLDCSVEFAE